MTTHIEQQAMRDWVVDKGYNVFCTLKFKNGYDIDPQRAERLLRICLQRLDRAYWGNRVERENIRCQRFVFLHKGTSGQNTHFHVLLDAVGDTNTFLQVVRGIWSRFAETDVTNSRFEVARNTAATGTYCIHEWSKLGSQSFCARLSHTIPPTGTDKGKNLQRVRRLLKAIDG